MDGLKLFVPITKVDAAKRLVYGTLVEEVRDQSDEIFDYASSKPLFQKWSEGFAKATNGQSVGNLRAMHQPIAAGKFTQMEFLDDAKRVDVCAKVVDDKEWAKVTEGVYTGFSIGGKYLKRWADGDLTRYTAEPVEGSLVDNPCIPTATFTMVKADGSQEVMKFKTAPSQGAAAKGTEANAAPDSQGASIPAQGEASAQGTPAAESPPAAGVEPTNDQIAAKAAQLAKAAGKAETAWAEFIEPARAELVKAMSVESQTAGAGATGSVPAPGAAPTNVDPRGDVEQGWRAKDGTFFAKKADALAHNVKQATAAASKPMTDAVAALEAAVAKAGQEPAQAGQEGQDGAPAGDPPAEGTQAPVQAPGAEQAAPGGAQEPPADPAEGADKTAKPGEVRKGLYALGRLADLLASLSFMTEDAQMEAIFEGDGSPVPKKLREGMRLIGEALVEMTQEEVAELIQAIDKRIGIDDALELAARPGALAKAANWQKTHDKCVKMGAKCGPNKAAAPEGADDPVAKLAASEARYAALEKVVNDTVPKIVELTKKVEALEKQPMPPKGPSMLVAVGKDQDGGGLAAAIEKMRAENPDALATLLIKASQQLPQVVFPRPGQAA